MCGIGGFWTGKSGIGPQQYDTALNAMADAVAHRGPDAKGIWQDDNSGIGLAHRRLAVIDLSDAGAQPMISASGRYVLVYNGELYNHRELRSGLDTIDGVPQWRGESDTEILLFLIEAMGAEAALAKVSGMFALAVWDRTDRSLLLARDRIGEKPLYYGRCGNTLIFGSELKALKAHPAFNAGIDRASVGAYLRFGYVPYPHTIYEGIHKLPPGHLIRFNAWNETVSPKVWWSLRDVAERGVADPFNESFNELLDKTEVMLSNVIESQTVSDVPLGVFLSGGVDSSLVAALMCKTQKGSVRSFSIGFHQGRFNEADHAKAVAEHLGTEHTEFMLNTQDALDIVESLPVIYDEPFADSSQLPTILLSRLAREHVTVALTGDGGDEIFGGYNRHVSGPTLWNIIRRIPRPLRMAGSSMASMFNISSSSVRAEWLTRMAVNCGLPITTIDRFGKFALSAGKAINVESFYGQIVSTFPDPENWTIEYAQVRSIIDQKLAHPFEGSVAEQWMVLDTLSYLPDDILVKVDRASMSASLETRAPFLDVRTVEFAWRLPIDAKISNGIGKRILREILWRHVPSKLVERPKQGFAIPLDDWLRGDLKEWANNLLSPSSIVSNGLLEPTKVSRLWQLHTEGRVNAGQQLWTILMLQAWLANEAQADAFLGNRQHW